MERLGRGVVAVVQGEGHVFVSWRLLGTDPENVAFNLYRVTGAGEPVRVNSKLLSQATCYQDSDVNLSQGVSYYVKPVVRATELAASAPYRLPLNAPSRPYLVIPVQTPARYAPNDASVGDLDGDGEYEIVLHQAGRGFDNSHNGDSDPPILQAYKLDGKLLWQINLGRNIREGAHYTQLLVYDLDGDGKAEVVCKTADSTVDGVGKTIGDPKAEWGTSAATFWTDLNS